jgi:SAM-dependent methyltransferase
MTDENCCAVTCDIPLNQTYWNNQYEAHATGWDLGSVSPPIKSYIDKIQNKATAILIPGCGNAYEAEYLLQNGFTNITVIDIAPALVAVLEKKFENNKNIRIVLGNFFDHKGTYDLILEQTFFCALPPNLRQKYVWKMHQLLAEYGILSGLLFNRTFEVSPPFGGNLIEYQHLFQDAFVSNAIGVAQNSIVNRANSELFFEFQKNSFVKVNLYSIEGITCGGCKATVSQRLLEIEGVKNVSMNTDFSELLVVSEVKIAVEKLQEIISYDEKYHIKEAIR